MRCPAEALSDQRGNLDIEPDEPIRICRTGLDVRRAALGIARPNAASARPARVGPLPRCSQGERRSSDSGASVGG